MRQQVRGPVRGDDAKQDGLCYAQAVVLCRQIYDKLPHILVDNMGAPTCIPIRPSPPPPGAPTCSSPASTRASLSMSLAPGAPSPNTTASAPLIPASNSTCEWWREGGGEVAWPCSAALGMMPLRVPDTTQTDCSLHPAAANWGEGEGGREGGGWWLGSGWTYVGEGVWVRARCSLQPSSASPGSTSALQLTPFSPPPPLPPPAPAHTSTLVRPT